MDRNNRIINEKERIVYVMTPVYNRADMIENCYVSLLKQTNQKFCWIIIDDGSTDDIRHRVEQFISENQLRIIFLSKQNGGKHTAINYGLNHIQNETALVLILDSDDALTEQAVDLILKYDALYGKNKEIGGFTFLRQKTDGEVWGAWGKHSNQDWISDYIESRVNFKEGSGEKADVYYFHAFNKYRFSEYKGEKYIGESSVGLKMAAEYKLVCVNQVIYAGSYCKGGLTDSGRKLRVQSPFGGMEYSYLRMNPRCNIIERIKAAILFNAYRCIAKYKNSRNMPNFKKYKFLRVLAWIPGFLLGKYWYVRWEEKG